MANRHRSCGSGTTIRLKDRERGEVVLNVSDGVVVGAMGSEPRRFIGLSLDQARRVARYGGGGSGVARAGFSGSSSSQDVDAQIEQYLGVGDISTGAEQTVVVAWTEDTQEVAPGQKMWRHDLGERPKFVDVKKAHAAMWSNRGTRADLEKARAWVAREYPGSGRVYVYSTTERDPLGRARRDVLAGR